VFLALTVSVPPLGALPPEELDGISFADDPHMLFVPIEEIARTFGWETHFDQEEISSTATYSMPHISESSPTEPYGTAR